MRSLRETARAEGAITETGKIDETWLKEKSKGEGVTAKRAELALILRELQSKGVTSMRLLSKILRR